MSKQTMLNKWVGKLPARSISSMGKSQIPFGNWNTIKTRDNLNGHYFADSQWRSSICFVRKINLGRAYAIGFSIVTRQATSLWHIPISSETNTKFFGLLFSKTDWIGIRKKWNYYMLAYFRISRINWFCVKIGQSVYGPIVVWKSTKNLMQSGNANTNTFTIGICLSIRTI